MSRRTELNREWGTDQRELHERGFAICDHCGRRFPLPAGRCRRRTCPGYAALWARDAWRKNRVNLDCYGGLIAMVTVTAFGEAAGLVWDRSLCRHGAGVRCDGRIGCRVLAGAAEQWNELSRTQWTELNRISKQRADRAVRRLGHDYRGGVLVSQWELQKRGVWHMHLVLGMETSVERVWAWEYASALRKLAMSKGFGWVHTLPLRSPQPAERAASYVSKYLAKWREDGSLEVSETVLSAGRSLLNYVSRRLTRETGCTMRSLRMVRVAWAFREGLIAQPTSDPFELLLALCQLERNELALRGP